MFILRRVYECGWFEVVVDYWNKMKSWFNYGIFKINKIWL